MDRTERFIALRSKGLSYADIAELVGLSRQRVYQIISGYGQAGSNSSTRVEIRKAIFARDNKQCQLCSHADSIVIHHIDGNDRNNDTTNLITLCPSCHIRYHKTNGDKPKLMAKEVEIIQPWREPYIEARNNPEVQRLWQEVLITGELFGRRSELTQISLSNYYKFLKAVVANIRARDLKPKVKKKPVDSALNKVLSLLV